MLTKRIIPCLDVKDGRVVKGVSFVNLRDAGDPVEVATIYDREGADELCFLDITASHENRKTIIDVVERTAARVFMPVTVGGGVRTLDDIRALLNAGADKVSINTAAVERPAFVQEAAQRFGTQCIVVAIDAKRTGASWEAFTHGGRTPTAGCDGGTPRSPSAPSARIHRARWSSDRPAARGAQAAERAPAPVALARSPG